MDNLSQDIEQILDQLKLETTRLSYSTGHAEPGVISIAGKPEATSALTQLFNKRLIEELEQLSAKHKTNCTAKGFGGWCCGVTDEVDDRIAQLKKAPTMAAKYDKFMETNQGHASKIPKIKLKEAQQ